MDDVHSAQSILDLNVLSFKAEELDLPPVAPKPPPPPAAVAAPYRLDMMGAHTACSGGEEGTEAALRPRQLGSPTAFVAQEGGGTSAGGICSCQTSAWP